MVFIATLCKQRVGNATKGCRTSLKCMQWKDAENIDNFICNVFWSILVDEMLVGSNSENTQPDSRDTRLEPEPVSSPSGLERREEEREEWAGGREVEALLQLAPEEAQSRLQSEAAELGRERAQQSREAAGISNLMYRDVQVCAGREGRGRLGGFGGCRIHSLSHTH